MDFINYTTKKTKEVFEELKTGPLGLGEQEAKERLVKYGLNKISAKEVGAKEIFLRQLKSPFIYLLLAATGLAFLLGEYSATTMIIVFVTINTVLGFYQEYQSERTIKLLKKHLTSKVRVKREGIETEINNEELVPGDIIISRVGDIAPADMRLIETENLALDESLLTGESVFVRKTSDRLEKNITEVHQAKNFVFSGTTVMSGRGTGVVVTTGKQTTMGKITKLTAETNRKSIFEKEIGKFSKFVLQLVVTTIVLLFVANLLIKGEGAKPFELALFSIALAVSVVPEALPVVTTFAFSRGARRLAKKHVVVKRLSSVEDLGGIEVLCTDKTGTLTENKMAVDEIYSLDKEKTLFYAALGSTVLADQKTHLDPFDMAILQKIPIGEKKLFQYKKVEDIPFDPERRRDATLIEKDNYEIIVRGAPETIVKLSKLSSSKQRFIEQWVVSKGKEGKRVLAIAKKRVVQKPKELEKEENNLDFLGLISFSDPIKKTSEEAVKQAQKLGVVIKIITGDRKEVAQSVAEQIGLTQISKEVITGEELDKLSVKKQHEAIERCKVFARISPQQKYKIIQLLEEKHEVGFLGDGINDAPALKLANVALAVQKATDIARESADIVLLKKDLKVIVDGIKEGREIFSNTTKYITATLASNFGNFYAVAAASLLIDFLPMLPIQILLVNLLSDFPMIAMAVDNVDSKELRQPQKYSLKKIIYWATVLGLVSSLFDFLTFGVFVRWSPAILQTSWFMESILTELIFIFSIRTKLVFFKSKLPSLFLAGTIGLAALVTVILPWTVLGRQFFGFSRPTGLQMAIILAIVFAYFSATEIVKVIYLKSNKKQ